MNQFGNVHRIWFKQEYGSAETQYLPGILFHNFNDSELLHCYLKNNLRSTKPARNWLIRDGQTGKKRRSTINRCGASVCLSFRLLFSFFFFLNWNRAAWLSFHSHLNIMRVQCIKWWWIKKKCFIRPGTFPSTLHTSFLWMSKYKKKT